MGNGITFNALECVKNLRSVGFTQEQAETQANEIDKAKREIENNLATKQDLSREIKEIEIKMSKMETDLKKYIGDQNLKLIGIIAALLAIFRFLPMVLNH